ncbi:MAG: hemolysin family protein [Candidatus Poribacteria bacterium]|nr:hemolysin family protein [Candidatus Poribacteria bacterium]
MKILLLSLFLIGAGSTAQIAVLSSFVLAVLICLVLSAFYSGSETALVSVNKIRINQLVESENTKAGIIHRLVESPQRMLALTLVGTNLANVLIAQFGEGLVSRGFPNLTVSLQGAIATVGITTLLLIFGEILPKTIFRVKADALALRYAYLLRLSEWVLAPLIYFVQTLTQFIVKPADKGSSRPSPDAQREELRLLATMGERSGNLYTDQRRMIHSLLNLQDRTVEQVMVPLVDIVAIEKNTRCEDFLQIAADSGFSRIPVYEEQIYNIVGIVNLLDVIYNDVESETALNSHDELDALPETVEPFIRKVLHVPESKNINALLKEIQHTRHTMVFAVDEYGGTVGLVTIEDLVEEIVGEFADERDAPELIRLIATNILECDGRTEVDLLEEHYGLAIPEGDYETVAGYILDRTGTIPKTGTELDLDDAIITVIDADPRAIRKVRIRRRLGRFTS